ncbi:MAG: ADP-ribosylation factor-like protein [Candidatus Hodarchaeales archaeon]|jgi:GTPase SAR1 family protein
MADTGILTPKGGKIVLFGLAGAGKTSIHHRCFLDTELPEIEKMQPTLLMSVDSPIIPFLEEELSFWDLGGQEGYIRSHLSDPQIFKNLKAIIYVVDCANRKALPKAKVHFASVEKILSENNEDPLRFVFLHKFDPDKRKILASNLSIFLSDLQTALPKKTMYLSTSIYDDSAQNAITDVLYSAFPVEVLQQAFSSTFLPEIYQKFNSETLYSLAKTSGVETVNQKLLDVFNSLGRAIANNLKISWSKILINKTKLESELKNDYLTFKTRPDRQIAISVKCPIEDFSIIKEYPIDVCLITRGLLAGVLETLRFGELTEIETIYHKGNSSPKQCHFLVLAPKGLEAHISSQAKED